MTRGLSFLASLLQLSRIGLILTAVSNIWLVVFLTLALPESAAPTAVRALPAWGYLLCTAATAIGMYVFGMTLNDVMDMRRDRLFAPTRPLPSRKISPAAAVGWAVGSLLVAIGGSLPLGTWSTLFCLLTAAMVLFYNGPGKHIAGVGVLTLGLIRASHMLIANPLLVYLWPVWLTMSHIIGLSALCHRLEEKRPRLTPAHLWGVTLGWSFASIILIGWMNYHGQLTLQGRPWVWVGPALAAMVFIGMAVARVNGGGSAKEAGALLMRRGLLWLMAYDAAWLISSGFWWQGLTLASMLPGTFLIIFISRQIKFLSDGPPRFERPRASHR